MEQDEMPKKTVYRKLNESHEEISEKRTSALGYILLGIMVIFIIIVGETIFSDLGDIPERPTRPSSCVLLNVEQLRTIQGNSCGRYNGFNLVDTKFGLDSQYLAIKSQIEEIASLNKKFELTKAR